MNKKGFIPIIFIVVGAVVIASAAFGVIKYKDTLSQIPAAVINVFMGQDEEQDIVEETVIEDEPEEEILDKKTEKAIEKEEKKEEKKELKGKRIVKGPKTGPKQEKPEEQVEEIQEQEEEAEVIEADVLTISDINVDINKISIDPVVITWITNKESNTSLEYGLRPGSYDWSIYNSVSKETDAGFLHAIYLYVEMNRPYYYRVSSTDLDGNRAESEDMTFRKIYFPFNVPCHPPKLPVVTSHTDGQTVGEGIIELKGTAAPNGTIFIQVNSLYETPVEDNGKWEKDGVILDVGENKIYIKIRNILNCESDIIFTLYVEDEEYNEGDEDGYNDGEEVGAEEGYDVGYWVGYWEGYKGEKDEDGYEDGYDEGYEDGYDVGYEDGYDDGDDVEDGERYRDGYEDGYDEGYDVGYWDGYEEEGGYNVGYDEGCEEGADNEDEEVGEEIGEEEGYDVGYWDGYDVGYEDGYEE